MSDASAVIAGLDDIRASLSSEGDGYAVTDDTAIGLPAGFRKAFRRKYFNSRKLHHDQGDWPVDRQRARDVVRYRWSDNNLCLAEHETITITDRAGIPGKRDHSRVWLLQDADGEKLINAFLQFVPLDRRESEGTFGVNLFRTFTNVVTTPHHDHEAFVIIYVIDRVGDGAETHLYLPVSVSDAGIPTAEPIVRRQLNPGDILIFDDKRFMHETSPLAASPGVKKWRDALVCTVDDPATYLSQVHDPCVEPSNGYLGARSSRDTGGT